VRPSSARGDEFVADAAWKRQVGEAIAVEVADLPVHDTELHAAEAMRVRRHPRPCQDGSADALGNLPHAICSSPAPTYHRVPSSAPPIGQGFGSDRTPRILLTGRKPRCYPASVTAIEMAEGKGGEADDA